jgi:hypothetical protein
MKLYKIDLSIEGSSNGVDRTEEQETEDAIAMIGKAVQMLAERLRTDAEFRAQWRKTITRIPVLGPLVAGEGEGSQP